MISTNMNKQNKQNLKTVLTLEQKARQIVEEHAVKEIAEDIYEVISQTNPNLRYGVNMKYRFCECKHHEITQNICKHIRAIELFRIQKAIADLVNVQLALNKSGGRLIATSNSTTNITTNKKQPLKIGVVV